MCGCGPARRRAPSMPCCGWHALARQGGERQPGQWPRPAVLMSDRTFSHARPARDPDGPYSHQ
ncbi:hypothetical protein EN933_07025 [Mesorhizobium sp. M7A.F.Ca.US.001.01.1.1]|nr:hypothetical protein EN933_07025 [Mesorhizobium sp. M7A.F.Ca.US.001.01.1.1]